MTSDLDRRGFLKATALALSSATLVGCVPREHVTLHYKLRIVVDIDGQRYEGASVIETDMWNWRGSRWRLPEMPQFTSGSRGEAVVVNLGQRGFLFGLLLSVDGSTGFSARHPEDTLSRCLPTAERRDLNNLLKHIQALEGDCELPDPSWPSLGRPALVRFRDINDPSSVELVEPARFSEIYGPNAAFVRATIAVTNDPLTEVIDRTLPWLARAELAAPGSTLVGKLPLGLRIASEMSLPERLSVRNFKLSGE